MPFTNFRNPYGLGLQDYDYQNAGGLPGLLRDAMQRQALLPGSGVGAEVSSTPNPYSESYGDPQGLLGRLLELQRKQGIPSGVDDASFASNAAPPAIPVQFRIPLPPGRLPLPPAGPMPQSPQQAQRIPMPSLPEPWPTIGKVMQMIPRLALHLDQGDDEQCPSCRAKEDGLDEEGAKKPRKPGGPKSPLSIPPVPPSFGSKSSKSLRTPGGGGGGGRRRGRDDDDSQCYERENNERANCYKRLEEYPHWDFLAGCLERASIRRDLCVRNGGRLDHEGPAEWDPDKDEEIYFDVGR